MSDTVPGCGADGAAFPWQGIVGERKDRSIPEVWLNSGLLDKDKDNDLCYPVCSAAREALLGYGKVPDNMISLVVALVSGEPLSCGGS